jgi:fatty-acyl-CoA synthase
MSNYYAVGVFVPWAGICLKQPEETAEAMLGGWLHTGNLGVVHAYDYIEIVDRAKDVIISGGENISSIELIQICSIMGLR